MSLNIEGGKRVWYKRGVGGIGKNGVQIEEVNIGKRKPGSDEKMCERAMDLVKVLSSEEEGTLLKVPSTISAQNVDSRYRPFILCIVSTQRR